MFGFTDKRVYLKGTGEAVLTDKTTGDIYYYSNKFTTGNYQTSVTMGEIRAGIGNGIAAIIPSDASVNVEFNAADFSLAAKAAQTGAALTYSAPVLVCQTVTPEGTELVVDVTAGTPVAQVGFDSVFGYVQEVGAPAPLTTYGTAYTIDPSTGIVADFTATGGTSYKVWYWVTRANAQIASITTLINPKVLHFMVRFPVYFGTGSEEDTLAGNLYAIVPSLKLGANGGITGDQTNADTTSISGQAIADDEDVIAAGCDDCAMTGSPLAYYIFVPCNKTESIDGLAMVGGVISVPVSTTHVIDEFSLVMADGSLVKPDAANMTYAITGTAVSGTSVTGNVITAGSTAGDTEITATYTDGDTTFTCIANLSIVSA